MDADQTLYSLCVYFLEHNGLLLVVTMGLETAAAVMDEEPSTVLEAISMFNNFLERELVRMGNMQGASSSSVHGRNERNHQELDGGDEEQGEVRSKNEEQESTENVENQETTMAENVEDGEKNPENLEKRKTESGSSSSSHGRNENQESTENAENCSGNPDDVQELTGNAKNHEEERTSENQENLEENPVSMEESQREEAGVSVNMEERGIEKAAGSSSHGGNEEQESTENGNNHQQQRMPEIVDSSFQLYIDKGLKEARPIKRPYKKRR